MNDIAFKVIIKNDGIDDVIFKTLMLKGEKGDKGDAGGAEIDDSTTSASKTWSSNKIRNEIDAKPVNLSQLGDVDLDTITDGQMLGYNLTAGKWENKTADASTLKYDANTSIKDKIDEKANTSDLATVATSGDYDDLSNKPQLASVATSGDYDDLINKPSIPPAQVNADWNASSGVAEILNKPQFATVATSGSYNDLSNKPTIPVVDQTLNPSSSNAISNSAVVNGLNGKQNTLTIDGAVSLSSTNPVQNKAITLANFFGNNGQYYSMSKTSLDAIANDVIAERYFSVDNLGDISGYGNRQFCFGWLNGTKKYGWIAVYSFGGFGIGKRNNADTFTVTKLI